MPHEEFRLLSGQEALTGYGFGTGAASAFDGRNWEQAKDMLGQDGAGAVATDRS